MSRFIANGIVSFMLVQVVVLNGLGIFIDNSATKNTYSHGKINKKQFVTVRKSALDELI